jgi:hypothetical protein
MQVSQQSRHLLIGKSPCKAGHHASASKHILAHLCIGSWNATWQGLVVKEAAEIRRYFLKSQIVVLVTVGTADLVEVLPFCLLWGEGCW